MDPILERVHKGMEDADKEDKKKSKKTTKKSENNDEEGNESDMKAANFIVANSHKAIQKVFDFGKQVFMGIFNVIKEIHGRLKQSSAFLSTVENLFNLAMNLFLMPIGNLLAEVMLPSMLTLLDDVLKMYETFEKFTENKDLNGIIVYAMDQGLKVFGKWFSTLGSTLRGTGNVMLHAVGELMGKLGTWLENGTIANLLNAMFHVFNILAAGFDVYIPMIVGLQIAQIAATIAAAAGAPGAYVGAIGLLGLASGYGATAVTMSAMSAGSIGAFASGGYVPATSGGQVVRVAEAGEGEYIIPESKMNNISNGGNYTVNINGATTDEIKRWVSDYVNDQMRQSRYRSGF